MKSFRYLLWCIICGFLTVFLPLRVFLESFPPFVFFLFGLYENDNYYLFVDELKQLGYWTTSGIITIIVSVIYWLKNRSREMGKVD